MVHLSEWPLRECFYNVYSDKLDHQRASESFWSKYFHVWISEGFAFFNQDRNEHWISFHFYRIWVLPCILEKLSYISRAGLLIRFPSESCCRPQTPLCKTSPNNVCLHFHLFIPEKSCKNIIFWIIFLCFDLYWVLRISDWEEHTKEKESWDE